MYRVYYKSPYNKWVWNISGVIICVGKPMYLVEHVSPLPLCLPAVPHEITWSWTPYSAVRISLPSTCDVAFHKGRRYYENILEHVFVLPTRKLPIIKYNFIEDFSFLWCYAVSTGKYLPKFRLIVMPSSSKSSSLRRNDFYSTCHNIPEDLDLQHHRYENFKCHIFFVWGVKFLKRLKLIL